MRIELVPRDRSQQQPRWKAENSRNDKGLWKISSQTPSLATPLHSRPRSFPARHKKRARRRLSICIGLVCSFNWPFQIRLLFHHCRIPLWLDRFCRISPPQSRTWTIKLLPVRNTIPSTSALHSLGPPSIHLRHDYGKSIIKITNRRVTCGNRWANQETSRADHGGTGGPRI